MHALRNITPEDIGKLPPAKRAQAAAILQELLSRETNKTVYGLVCPEKGHTHSIAWNGKEWAQTKREPTVYLPAKLERVITTKARHVYLIGGRGSGKSIGAADICLADAHDHGSKTFCLREYQSSIADSVHALLAGEIERLELDGFDITQNTIARGGAPVFRFAGLARNPSSIKSAYGFRRWLIEEAQFLSEESIRILLPSARKKPNKGLPGQEKQDASYAQDDVQLIFLANLGSMADPFTVQIAEYLDEARQNGFYEDDVRLIIWMNYNDNPWFAESGMEREREEDKLKLDPAVYRHVWEGETNDHIENALVLAEWFDACIDAHLKLGFEPRGLRFAAHDAADMGKDAKGYAMRHGSVVLNCAETLEGNVNEGARWAVRMALEDSVDYFTWDVNGIGAGLGEQFSKDFEGKKVDIVAFQSSESPDDPRAIYKPAVHEAIRGQLSNEDVFKNKRAQYAFELRDRIYRTYLAVTDPKTHGYQDPDTLISFAGDMPLLMKLRAETCRIPRKLNRNGINELYSKEEMRVKFKLKSPNLFDSLMMLMRYRPSVRTQYTPRPPVIPAMRARR